MKLHFTLRFLSDFHLGSGKGSSEVDGLLVRESDDADAQLTIKGTTIVGVLRQSLYDLIQLNPFSNERKCKRSGKSNGSEFCTGSKEEQCPICRILGTPKQVKPWFFSSGRLSDDVSTQTITRSSIDRETRTSKEGKLFTYEVGSKETSFQFVVEHDVSSSDVLWDAAYIVAGFRFIRSLGSSRRRGKGRCIINLTKVQPDIEGENPQSFFLELFNQVYTGGNNVEKPEELDKAKIAANAAEYIVEVRTEEPVLITQNRGSGNLYSGLDFIPGSTLRGALAWKAIRGGILASEEGEEIFKTMFTEGKLRVGNCYPAGHDDKAAIPTPMNLRFCEFYPNQHDISRNMKHPMKCESCRKENREAKMDKSKHFLDSNMMLVRNNSTHDMHIEIDPEEGTVREGVLYGYEGISMKSRFLGAINVEPEILSKFLGYFYDDVKQESEKIAIQLQIGKATRRGYGKSIVTLTPKSNVLYVYTWDSIENRVNTINKTFTLTFISDAILIDKYGRYLNQINKDYLYGLLGYETEIVGQVIRTKYVEQFDMRSGLPRWRNSAIIAGSVVEFRLKNTTDVDVKGLQDKLKEIESNGVGIKTVEGFGVVCFNHPAQILVCLQNRQATQDAERQKEKELETVRDVREPDKKSKEKLVAIARLLYTGEGEVDKLEKIQKSLKQDDELRIHLRRIINEIKKYKQEGKKISDIAERIYEGGI